MIERTLQLDGLELAQGGVLENIEQRVTIYGEPNKTRSNIVLVPHALTGNSRVAEWWSGLIGRGRAIDPDHHCIVGINALGSCYGSSGPLSAAQDGAPYGDRFPTVTVSDMVRAQARALDQLGFERLALAIGGSLGGMQALQWALAFPERIGHAVVVGASDRLSAMGIALNAIQRECIDLDPVRGLGTARKIAMLTYKSSGLLTERYGRKPDRTGRRRFDIEGYLRYQASIFIDRMDATSYRRLSLAMDLFEPKVDLLLDHSPGLTFIGITSDWLFPPQDVRASARRFTEVGFNANYRELQSNHGHDAFLAEPYALAALIKPIFDSTFKDPAHNRADKDAVFDRV
ncbi:MAG: homoserine O-acetyltransferase [Candidatus Eremiobacteraeota bacterium]|nr:homoserine O-acetyltransferase [Candidatus Eremiobacteraeota bacterium]